MSCVSIPNDYDKTKWINDSLCCNGYRQKLAHEFYKNNTFHGRTKEDLVKYLGYPDYTATDSTCFFYCFGTDMLCDSTLKPEMKNYLILHKDNSERAWIQFRLENNIVVETSIGIP